MNSNNFHQLAQLYGGPPEFQLDPNDCNNGEQLDEEVAYTPLHHVWSIWHFEYNMHQKWRDMLTHLQDFETAERFWLYYNIFSKPSQLKPGTGYLFFKKDIHPMWEHPANKDGGRWIIKISKNLLEVDNLWLNLMLCLIGNIVDCRGQICGAVLSVYSKEVKMAVWTTNCDNMEANNEIARNICEQLHLDLQSLLYHNHIKGRLQNQAEQDQQTDGKKTQK